MMYISKYIKISVLFGQATRVPAAEPSERGRVGFIVRVEGSGRTAAAASCASLTGTKQHIQHLTQCFIVHCKTKSRPICK